MFERTYAGLDVHARSVVGAAIDGVSGEIRSLQLAPQTEAVGAIEQMAAVSPFAPLVGRWGACAGSAH